MTRLCVVVLTWLCLTAAWPADERHEMARALDQARHLVLLQSLNPSAQDLATMLATSRTLVRYQAEYDRAHEAALTQSLGILQAERNSLASGTPLAAATAKALADLRAAEADRHQKLLRDIDEALRQMARRLDPALSQRVDWTPPPDIALPRDDTAKSEQLRLLAARLEETARALDRIRYLPIEDYAALRVNRLREFLRDYREPGTRAFDQALDFMLELTNEMKRVPEPEYPERRILYAARTLQYLGLLGDDLLPPVQALSNWTALYDLLSDPQTPALLEKIVNRLNTGGGQ